ncbi:LysR family transcriptional regulator [Sphingoaurantiacus capsulatus]|uniref:LysR family transcriptional regulator n=1 Tax=Sphingoaurantiacus capsulatus TaxID=1771310 RepID=A0ABV7XDC4_9SPHN
MSNPGLPTFDQLRIFLAVVETGSFAGAGRKLNRATSVISYGVANLEAQLGLMLFDREGTKKPQLTVAGQAVLAEARSVAHGIDGLRAKVKGLLDGLEAEVTLAVDVMVPDVRLADSLKAFQQQFPSVPLRLHVEALGAVAALVLEGRASIGISGPLAAEIGGIERISMGQVPLIPVAAPDHPLARMSPVPPGVAREHLQLVLTDRSPLTEGRDFSVVSAHSWRLADLGAKHALLRQGIGWGNMPVPMIEADLFSGALVRLDLPDHRGGSYRFDGIYRSDAPPGPAATWLLQYFAEHEVGCRREDVGRLGDL